MFDVYQYGGYSQEIKNIYTYKLHIPIYVQWNS
jgi:hypothetical protein